MFAHCNIETRSRYHYCLGKAIIVTYSECVFVALVIQHVKRMRRIKFSYMPCPVLPNFSKLSHKWHDFGKVLLNTKCVFLFSLQLLPEIFFSF